MSGRLKYIQGDLLTTHADVIAHCVNCMGTFGGGVAGQIAKYFPNVRQAYMDKYRERGWRPGEIQVVFLPTKIFVNCAGQVTYGRTGVHIIYSALQKCLDSTIRLCCEADYSLAIPRLGSGLAGGNWSIIEGMIRDLLLKYNVNISCYSPPN